MSSPAGLVSSINSMRAVIRSASARAPGENRES